MRKRLFVSMAVLLFGMCIPASVWAENLSSDVKVEQQEVKYKEIASKEIPEGISETIEESFVDYEVLNAFLGSDGSYKIFLGKEDETIAVYFNSEGEFLKKEHLDV